MFEFKPQQKDVNSKKDLDQEAAVKHSQEELEARNKKITLLENQIKDLEHKLKLADAKSTEKVCFSFTTIKLPPFSNCNNWLHDLSVSYNLQYN